MKKIMQIKTNDEMHWVGDGFPVKNIFSYRDDPEYLSPFLLLDFAERRTFDPNKTNQRRGVGPHPHKGFETVTVVYEGQVEHRDSAGGGGVIQNGDVQWMTAAGGIVHEEFHGKEFSEKGGPFEMVQLWVNLPKKHKLDKPRYQGITNSQIPRAALKNDAGTVRVIAGEFNDSDRPHKGPAKTFSDMNMWDIRMKANKSQMFHVPEGHNAIILVLSGDIILNDEEKVPAATVVTMSREETEFKIAAVTDAKILFLGGAPLNEPVVGYGPFVMNTEAEIKEAYAEYQSGKMGRLV